MKSLTEQQAILSIHQGAAGQYLIRVADLKYRPLVIEVTKLLSDAESFVLITPADIKVFSVSGNGTQRAPAASRFEQADSEATLDAETLAAIEREEKLSTPGQVQESEPSVPAGAEVVGETSQGSKVVRRKKSPTPSAGHDEPCQRCSGNGEVKVLLDGGAAATAACPICKGAGIMRRYGSKR